MGAARIVPDIAAQRAAGVRRRIRRESQAARLGDLAELVVDDTGLHPGTAAVRIDSKNSVHVFREIDHHRDVACLTRQAGAAAAAEDRYVSGKAGLDRRLHVGDIFRDHHADRYLAINRQIRRIEGAIGVIETDFAGDASGKRLGEIGRCFPPPPLQQPGAGD
jgi:hypothetical protein